MLVEKILSAIAKVLIGDVAACYKNLRKGIEPYTNFARVAALIFGGLAGALLTSFWLTEIMNYFITSITGATLSNFEAISLSITDNSIGIIVGSRTVDFVVSKMIVPSYYYLKYGHTRELYKDFNNKEIKRIHENIATQPESDMQTVEEIEHSIQHEGYSEEQIKEIIDTKLSGTLGLLIGIRKQVIDFRENAREPEIIDNHWLLLRKGKIDHLCLLSDSYVTNILMQRFDLPKLNGRRRSSGIFPLSHEEKKPDCVIQVSRVELPKFHSCSNQEPVEFKGLNFFPPDVVGEKDTMDQVEPMRLE
jgi:hypothetical protein